MPARQECYAQAALFPALEAPAIKHPLRSSIGQMRSSSVDRRAAARARAAWVLTAPLLLAAPRVASQGLREINPPPEGDPTRVVAIAGGRLIDGRGGPPLPDGVVLVRGDRIVAAGPRGSVPLPEGAEHVDATGLSVLPGLIDVHFHSINDLDVPELFLRHGVTTFRDPGHPFRFYQAVRHAERPMPRVFLCGAHLDSYPAVWPQQAVLVRDEGHARRVVTEHVDGGATAIKVYFRLPLDLIRPVCETAHARGVPVTAHLELVDADAAIRAGVDGIEHVTSFGTALADPEVAEGFRSAVAAASDARHERRYALWAALALDGNPRLPPLVDLLVASGTYVSPTLAVFERRPGDEGALDHHVRGFETMLDLVGRFHAAGVRVAVGSHTWVPHAELGWAYQRELELLVESGISPAQAIHAATLLNAGFLGAEDRLGSLEPGKAADLLLVEGDPTRDIRAMREVRRVMLNGRWVQP